jgi:hypothetical protein
MQISRRYDSAQAICHGEGRGFESHHPLLETRWKQRVLRDYTCVKLVEHRIPSGLGQGRRRGRRVPLTNSSRIQPASNRASAPKTNRRDGRIEGGLCSERACPCFRLSLIAGRYGFWRARPPMRLKRPAVGRA